MPKGPAAANWVHGTLPAPGDKVLTRSAPGSLAVTKQKQPELLNLACAEVQIAVKLSIREPALSTVRDYAQSMRAGAEFPPIDVALIRGRYILIDGRHRLAARPQTGETIITAWVHKVTWAQASAMAAVANTRHGRPLKGTEKGKALAAFLRDPENAELSLQEVVDALNGMVSRSTVRNYRNKMRGSQVRGSDTLSAEDLAELAADVLHDRLLYAADRQLKGLAALFRRMKDPELRHHVVESARAIVKQMEAEGNARPGPLDI